MQKEDLVECQKRIAPYIHRTPILTSRLIDKMGGVEIFFKCENFQRMGAYKMRGATNAILQLSDEQRSKGVRSRLEEEVGVFSVSNNHLINNHRPQPP